MAKTKVNYNEIHNKKMEDLIEVPDEAVEKAVAEVENEEKPEEKVEETVEKTKVEEKAEEIKEDVEEIDIEEMEKRVSEKVQKETVEKITKALTGEKAEEEQVSAYKKFANETWKKEGRNPTYEEALEFVSEQAVEALEKRQAEKIQKEEETKKTQEKAQAEREANLNKYIDSELEDLIGKGKIPAITNKDDENDPGVRARRAIFQAMLDVNKERTAEGKDPIYSPKIIYYEHYKAPTQQPAGADAPVFGGKSGSVASEDNKFNYNDIHKKSFMDIMLGR